MLVQLLPVDNRRSKLTEGEWLGEGSYGQVYEGSYFNMAVAIKRLFNSRMGDEPMRRMRREAAMLFDINHPNLVKLMGLSIGDGDLVLVMELVPGGSLRDLLSNASRKLSWKDKVALLRDGATGIAFLHSVGIVHRDIKSSNLLMDADGNVKVADFGFATAKQQNVTMTRCGTPAWTAPEVLMPPNHRSVDGDDGKEEGGGRKARSQRRPTSTRSGSSCGRSSPARSPTRTRAWSTRSGASSTVAVRRSLPTALLNSKS